MITSSQTTHRLKMGNMKIKQCLFFIILLLSSNVQAQYTIYELQGSDSLRVDTNKCLCYSKLKYATKMLSQFQFAPYEMIQSLSGGWHFAGDTNFYPHLYYADFGQQICQYQLCNKITLVAYRPIRFMSPTNTFGMNLTPCNKSGNVFELPAHCIYSQPIKRNRPWFEYSDFDHSPKSYLDILFVITGTYGRDFITSYSSAYSSEDLKNIIVNLNKTTANKIEIKDSVSNIKSLIRKCDESDAPIDFIYNTFIKSPVHSSISDSLEKEQILKVFSQWIGAVSLKDIDEKVLKPSYFVSLAPRIINIEISENIIRQWNEKKRKPLLDEKGNSKPSNILLYLEFLQFSTQKGITFDDVNSVFMTISELTGTGVTFKTNKADVKVIPNSLESDYPFVILEKTSFPFLDSSITKFTGLYIKESNVKLPFKHKFIQAQGKDFLINNLMVTGTIEIPKIDTLKNNPDGFLVLVKRKKVFFSKIEFDDMIKQLGFTNYALHEYPSKLCIDFLKKIKE